MANCYCVYCGQKSSSVANLTAGWCSNMFFMKGQKSHSMFVSIVDGRILQLQIWYQDGVQDILME